MTMERVRYIGNDPRYIFHGEYDAEYNPVSDSYWVSEIGAEYEARVFFNEFELIEGNTTVTTEPTKLFTPPSAPEHYSKHQLLDDAKAATADRGLNYGKPEDNFARIAAHWNAFLFNRGIIPPTGGGLVSPSDVAIMCALLKIARLENQPGHKDSWIDLAGYAACGAEIELSK